MKKLFILLPILLLASCNNASQVQEEEKERTYDTYISKRITWSQIFTPQDTSYFIYVYSESCYYCNSIKEYMFDFIESDLYPIYLIQYNKDIPVGYDLSQTVGVSCYEKLYIGGTPSLIHIVNKEVFVNIAGAEKITTYIDLFMFNYYRLLKI